MLVCTVLCMCTPYIGTVSISNWSSRYSTLAILPPCSQVEKTGLYQGIRVLAVVHDGRVLSTLNHQTTSAPCVHTKPQQHPMILGRGGAQRTTGTSLEKSGRRDCSFIVLDFSSAGPKVNSDDFVSRAAVSLSLSLSLSLFLSTASYFAFVVQGSLSVPDVFFVSSRDSQWFLHLEARAQAQAQEGHLFIQ